MQYDFNRPIDRWDNYAVKYDEMEQKYGRRDLLPMWIADMDLCTRVVGVAEDEKGRAALKGRLEGVKVQAVATFNLAGLQAATIIFPNEELIAKYQKFWKSMDVHRNNCFRSKSRL